MSKQHPIIKEAIEDIKFRIADGLVDVQLETSDYMRALNQTRKLYLQRAENSTVDVLVQFETKKDIQKYDLSDLNIITVRRIIRHSIGTSYSADNQLDPFSLMYANNLLSGFGSGSLGSVALMHMQHMHVNLLNTMMANEVQFNWDRYTNTLTLYKAMRRNERIILECEAERSLEDMLYDKDINYWFISYASALCKQILGIAYSKFATMAGPNGGVSLGGDALRQEGKEEQIALEEQLTRLVTSTRGMPFTRG